MYTHREVVEFVADLTTLRTDMLNVPFPILAMASDLVNFLHQQRQTAAPHRGQCAEAF